LYLGNLQTRINLVIDTNQPADLLQITNTLAQVSMSHLTHPNSEIHPVEKAKLAGFERNQKPGFSEEAGFSVFVYTSAVYCNAAWAAAKRAIGTRKAEQLT